MTDTGEARSEPAKDRKPALEPAVIVIFGITGDLSRRSLLPALYHLFKDDMLHADTVIVGVTRRDVSADDLLKDVELCVNEQDGVCDPAGVQKVRAALRMFKMDITDGGEYGRLKDEIYTIEEKAGVCMNRLYYLSIPPQVYAPIVRFLGENGLNGSCNHGTAMSRLLVEKPFGFDLDSARELIDETSTHYREDQIFRIDHYLAKETVQNILAFRFNNPIFEPLMNAKHVSAIQITASEELDIEGRVAFYEKTGALRDLIQSHLLQIMAVVMMDKPAEMNSDAIHGAKERLLKEVEPVSADAVDDNAVRGQYEGYRDEVKDGRSTTETYAAIRLNVGSDRWDGVPVLIRTGKALDAKRTDVNVLFKQEDAAAGNGQNALTFKISPDEGIELNLVVKKPGFEADMQPVPMDFSYQRSFTDAHGHPNAYERVLVDAVRGDKTLFATGDEVLASWRAIQPVLERWQRDDTGLETYPKVSSGPESATGLAERAGTVWL
jgi:glucose-6-phosphate 1-dehydrogenase